MSETKELKELVALGKRFENHRAISYEEGWEIIDIVENHAAKAAEELKELIKPVTSHSCWKDCDGEKMSIFDGMSDFMLYKEALSACGDTIIKTEELEKLRAELADALKVVDLAELTDGQMPSDTLARLAATDFRRKYPNQEV